MDHAGHVFENGEGTLVSSPNSDQAQAILPQTSTRQFPPQFAPYPSQPGSGQFKTPSKTGTSQIFNQISANCNLDPDNCMVPGSAVTPRSPMVAEPRISHSIAPVPRTGLKRKREESVRHAGQDTKSHHAPLEQCCNIHLPGNVPLSKMSELMVTSICLFT